MIISWGNFIRRSKSIAELASIEDVHLKPIFKKTILKPINYLVSFIVSSYLIVSKRKKIAILVLVTPPNFLLYLVFVAKIFTDSKVIVDCHNGTFSSKWLKVPFVKTCLKNADKLLLHNDDFAAEVMRQSIAIGLNFMVVPDPPAIPDNNMLKDDKSRKLIFPASYSEDEPIDELISFLESVNFQNLDCRVYLTGPSYKLLPDKRKRIETIKNVVLTGFLEIDEYETLLNSSLAVLCLTKFEGIQLCAINEAVGFSCIPIFSNTQTLNRMYGSIGVPVNIDLTNLAKVLQLVFNDSASLLIKVAEEKVKRLNIWKTDYLEVFKAPLK